MENGDGINRKQIMAIGFMMTATMVHQKMETETKHMTMQQQRMDQVDQTRLGQPFYLGNY